MSLLFLLLACQPGQTPSTHSPVDEGAESRGLLQFHLEHNLEDADCLASGDCFLEIEETADVAGWIEELARDGNQPVLHWDRGVPWSAFAEAPPAGEDLVSFYEARIDPALLAWIDAYAAWFQAEDGGYLALSMLDGTRDRLAPELMPDGSLVPVGETCPDLGPAASFTAADGRTFSLGQAWTYWTRFMVARLEPDQLALQVEANLYQVNCPDRWASLVDQYRSVHDAVRPELDAEVQVFATLSLPPLLGFSDACVPELAWTTCEVEPGPSPDLDPNACFPGAPDALWDLAEGDRLDALALSFYPDGLGVAPPGVSDARLKVWFEGTDPDGTCDAWARLPAWPDPLARLSTLGWTGPIGFAETSSRSCPALQWWDDGSTAAAVLTPGSEDGQVGWLQELVGQPDRFDFVVQSFDRDYPPLGLWTVEQGVLDPGIYNLFNLWACSGLRTAAGDPKVALEYWGIGFGMGS